MPLLEYMLERALEEFPESQELSVLYLIFLRCDAK
jgi:hypothetical protein